ncbi:MAG: VPLPA-CTERM sorting domain-containing protein [Pseudomonadota bacterium]
MIRIGIAACAALLALASISKAATYSVDGLINISAQGFGSSLIHEQDYDGDMSGATVSYFDEAVSGGTWADTGDIDFAGTWNGFGYSATGNIDQTTAGGFLTFAFAPGAIYDALTFYFDEALDMGLPNSFDGTTAYLWGGTNTCANTGSCQGIDLRIAVSAVPLPAPALMLLAGLAAFGGLRARQKRLA